MILNLTAFIGATYVCEFCYKGYSNRRNHHCKHICNVCFDGECYKHPKKTMHCDDCLRFSKSGYCYEMHKKKKKTPPGAENPACDVIKYCKLCGRQYVVTGQSKNHKYAPHRCIHCNEDLPNQGSHNCFIQPIPKDPCNKYIFYDFETQYVNDRHEMNFVCDITFKGEKFGLKARTA